MEAKFKFSLPYREGMESKPGYVEKKEAKQKGHEGESVFAFFSFTEPFTRKDVKKTDAELIQAQCETIIANQKRVPMLTAYAKEYGIELASGAAGGLTKTDKSTLVALFELSTNYVKIKAALQKGDKISAYCKALTVDELDELAQGELAPVV